MKLEGRNLAGHRWNRKQTGRLAGLAVEKEAKKDMWLLPMIIPLNDKRFLGNVVLTTAKWRVYG
jgi:hypothetical protein